MNVFIISVSNDYERKSNMKIRNGFKHIFFVAVLGNLSTVIIRFSARGAYLLLVPQGRLFVTGRLFLF